MLDCTSGEQLDENWFANLVYFKMGSIGCPKLLRERFPMRRRKEFKIHNGGGNTDIKECNHNEGFDILRKTYRNLGCRDRLILERRARGGKNTVNIISYKLLIV